MAKLPGRRLLGLSAFVTAVCVGAGLSAWAMVGPSRSATPPSAHEGAAASASGSGTETNSGSPASAGSTSTTGTSVSVGSSGSIASTGTGVAPPGSIVSTPTTSSTTSTTPTSAPPGTLVLTASSAGQSFVITPGQRVQIVLSGTGQQYHGFTTPQSDAPTVVAPDGVSCDAPSGEFCTEFVGESTGTARLTSTNDPACRQASPPCEVASQEWWVNLTVR